MEAIFFHGWFTLLRTAVVGILAYAALVLFLRFSGKRTLAKMNAFDLVVTWKRIRMLELPRNGCPPTLLSGGDAPTRGPARGLTVLEQGRSH